MTNSEDRKEEELDPQASSSSAAVAATATSTSSTGANNQSNDNSNEVGVGGGDNEHQRTYNQTEAQIDAISKEIKDTQMLTSSKQSIMESLGKHYENDKSSNFYKGVQYLSRHYSSMRTVRGDGNCYYRAFLYSLCEALLVTNKAKNGNNDDDDDGELQRIYNTVKTSIDEIEKYGYDKFTIEMFYDELVELIDLLIKTKSSSSSIATIDGKIHEKLNEENATSDYCTWYLRVLTACHIKKDPDRFVHFLEPPYIDVNTFCSREIEPMGKECGMIQALALAEYLNINLTIEYLDGHNLITTATNGSDSSSTEEKLTQHNFVEESKTQITLLYRPGHYDILYK